jgi:hypothetical protein
MILPGAPPAAPPPMEEAEPIRGIQTYDRDAPGPASQTFRAYQPYAPAVFYRVPAGRRS